MPDRKSAVQREIHQSRPFRTKGTEATIAVMRTASVLQRRLSQAIEPSGITRQQYNVLRILRGAGDDGLPTLAIRDRMIEEAPGITRLLDRIERAGLVSRERCSPDRRQVLCHITAKGLELLDALEQRVDAVVDDGMAVLQPSEQEQLVALLDKVRAAPRR